MLSQLEQTIGYTFINRNLLSQAMTHSSYANEHWHNSLLCNERLEFLGDSILGMMVAEHLYKLFPNRPEGELTRIRADMVCEQALARVADKLHLGRFLLLGHGEEQGGGRNRSSILADAVESLIAACYLDGGPEAALRFIRQFVLTEVPAKQMHNIDYKTALQELVQQKKSQVLEYTLLGASGPDHAKEFTVQVSLNGAVVGQGVGSSKKRAEQNAACCAIEKLFPNRD